MPELNNLPDCCKGAVRTGSELPLFVQVRVLEPQEVEYAVQPDGIDGLFGVRHYLGLGMESPASASMGRSLAPSPTAMVWAMSTFSTCAMSFSSSALRRPSTISPR